MNLEGTTYIVEDNRERKRKDFKDLSLFKSKNYKVLLQDQNVKQNPDKLGVQDVPLEQINVNTKLFQNRKKHFSQESVNRILQAVENNTFNWELFDPVLLWQDDDGKLWILSGHSRTEAFRQLSEAGYNDFRTIPAKIISGISEEQAQAIALKSNTLSTKELESERANYYREQLKVRTKKDVKKECDENEGKNSNFIFRLAHLNPNGKLYQDYVAVETSSAGNVGTLKTFADWIGQALVDFPYLTNFHERELYDWLTQKYGKAQGQFTNRLAFQERLFKALEKQNFQPGQTLNLIKFDTRSSYQRDYDTKLREIEKNLRDAQNKLENKRINLLAKKVPEDRLFELIEEFHEDVNYWADQLLTHKDAYNKYLEAEKKQTSLFGLSLGMNTMFFDLTVLADLNDLKKAYRLLALEHHPDRGGDLETMKQINKEYDYLFENFAKAKAKQDINFDLESEIEFDEKFKDIIENLIVFNGLEIELIGSWIWVSGNTYPIREQLKSLGFNFAGKKKMWYWHAGDYRKKGRKELSIDDIRKLYKSQKITKRKYQKSIGAVQVLKQNEIDFKGFIPTYKKVNFSHFIKRQNGDLKGAYTIEGDLNDTIKILTQLAKEKAPETSGLAIILKASTPEQTLFNIWHFLQPIDLGGQINYSFDTPNEEDIKTPARLWEERFIGADCEDKTLFAATILENLYIPYEFNIVGFKGDKTFQHIYLTAYPKTKKIILDSVLKKFNERPEKITNEMKINILSGLHTDLQKETIIKSFAGLSNPQTEEVKETALKLLNLRRLIKIKDALEFADIESNYNQTLNGIFSNAINSVQNAISNVVNSVQNTVQNVVSTAQNVVNNVVNTVQDNQPNNIIAAVGLAPARGAFLTLVKFNYFNIAKILYIGYLTKAEALRLNFTEAQWTKANTATKKIEQIFVKAGGQAAALKQAATEGKNETRFIDGVPNNLGDPIAIIIKAVTIAAQIIPPVMLLIKAFKKDDLTPKNKPVTLEDDKPEEETKAPDTEENKWLIPALVVGGASILLLTQK